MTPDRRDVANALRQLAVLARLGYPLSEGMRAMSSAKSPWLDEAGQAMERGDTLAQALSRQPRLFSPFFSGLLEAAEGHCQPDQALDRLSHWLERSEFLERRLANILLYPLILLLTLAIFLGLLFTFVFPHILVPFLQELHYVRDTAVLDSLCLVLSIAAFLGAGLLGLALVLNWPVQPWLGRLPGLRQLCSLAAQSLWARALGSLLATDMPVPEAIERSLSLVIDPALQAGLRPLAEKVRRGDTLAAAAAQVADLQGNLLSSLQSEQPAGRLLAAADRLEEDLERCSRRQLDLLAPQALLGVGLLVGAGIVIFWWPFYTLSTQFTQ